MTEQDDTRDLLRVLVPGIAGILCVIVIVTTLLVAHNVRTVRSTEPVTVDDVANFIKH